MSSNDRSVSIGEAVLFLAAAAGLLLWYAKPQILFSLYGAYELLRLLLPIALPALAAPAG